MIDLTKQLSAPMWTAYWSKWIIFADRFSNMPNFSIRPASVEDIPVIQGMAEVVFRKTYADILSPEQMEYMMDWMYSEDSLRRQIAAPGKGFHMNDYIHVLDF